MTNNSRAAALDERMARLRAIFCERFGRAPDGIAEAPGRVNLIGEHLDYNGGTVLPVAIDRSVLVAFASRDDADVCAYAAEFREDAAFRLGQLVRRGTARAWADYVRGVVSVLSEAHNESSGLDLAISGDVPLGAGLSSSAALEVAIAGALRAAWRLDLSDKQLALLCQRAENDFVGVRCGVMDQFTSALGRAEHALLINCRTLEYTHIPLALDRAGFALVVVDSGQQRTLNESDYNRRREECGEALEVLRTAQPEKTIETLRDVTLADLTSLEPTLCRRVRHVVTERSRVERAVVALHAGDIDVFGHLMNESHASLRDDFEVSTSEIDRLVELAQGQDYVMGARLTGAGFGGCMVSLVRADTVGRFETDVVERYASETKLSAQMLVCSAADGLRVHGIE